MTGSVGICALGRSVACAGAAVAASASAASTAKPKLFTVRAVTDGDTIRLSNNQRVRLVQIDAPETSSECYGNPAKNVLAGLLPVGTKVKLQSDPALDDVDRYGRLLRYVVKDSLNLNIALVTRGAATVWFFDGDRGRHADRLLTVARRPRGRQRSLGCLSGHAVRPGERSRHRSRYVSRSRRLSRTAPTTTETARSTTRRPGLREPERHERGRRQSATVELRSRLPDRMHPAATARPRLRRHHLHELHGSRTRPTPLRRRPRRRRLRDVGDRGDRSSHWVGP